MDKKALQLKISTKIESLRDDIKELRIIAKPIAPENSIGRISRMDAINNKSINEEDFGKCIQCKQQINEQRIALMPEVLKCIRCA